MRNSRHNIIIYGGNGFIGTHLAEKLSSEELNIVCLSRSGHKPLHLKDQPWSEKVRWCKGDANKPDEELLSRAKVVVILVGSAPFPTLSQAAYQQQLNSNGEAPRRVIEAALKVGVKQIVLMGAQIPCFLNHDFFAYARGKRDAFKSAKDFAERSEEHSAVVLQPGAIYGKRYLNNGKVIPLNTFMSPLAKVLPSQFICINRLTNQLRDAIINHGDYRGKFTHLKQGNI